MKTKRTPLAPIAVEILMARGSGHKIVAESGTTRVVRKEVLLLEKKSSLVPMLTISLKYFAIPTFYLFPRFVHQLQKNDSFFIAIFAPNRVG